MIWINLNRKENKKICSDIKMGENLYATERIRTQFYIKRNITN